VPVNSIFSDPLGGALHIPTVKMYRIMKICKVCREGKADEEEEDDFIQWDFFLKQYFAAEENSFICFEHVVCAAVAKHTEELSHKLLKECTPSLRSEFVEEAFSYVFEVL
jgi:hypothetical protein